MAHHHPRHPRLIESRIMDLATLTDEELAEHRIAVLNEQERRSNLAAIPAQVASLAAQYVAAGGDRADLDTAVSTA